MADQTQKLAKIDNEIVKALLETKAINFEALGKVLTTVGPGSISMDDDGWIRWCGSDLRIYRWPRPRLGLEDVIVLRDIVRDLPQRVNLPGQGGG